jgi:hypothetical protein
MEKGRLLEPKSPSAQNPVYGPGLRKKPRGVTPVSARHRLPAIPIAPLQVLVPFVFDPPRMQRRLTPSLPTRLCSAMSPISLGGPAPVFQTQAKVARSLAVSETSTDGVVDPWWSYARLIRSD